MLGGGIVYVIWIVFTDYYIESLAPMKIFPLLLAFSLGLAACTKTPSESAMAPKPGDASGDKTESGAAKDANAQTKLLVVTTVAPLTNIASNIAGDRTKVAGIIPEGTNSHTFEPRPSDGDLLAKANLILVNGLDLEDPSINLANAIKPAGTEIYELGTNTISKDQWVFDNSFPKAGGKPNPHLWVSTAYAEAYAKESAEQLTKLDPEGADYYKKNLDAYLVKLAELDRVTREVVASIPAANRKLLTYHDSWPYWAKQYGFEVIGAIQPSDFNEPSAQDVAALIDQIRQTGVPAIFGSEVFPSKVEEQIAQEANVKLANTSDDDLPGEGSANAMENDNPDHTYIGMMADNLRILADNLGGDASLVDQLDTTNVVGPAASKG